MVNLITIINWLKPKKKATEKEVAAANMLMNHILNAELAPTARNGKRNN